MTTNHPVPTSSSDQPFLLWLVKKLAVLTARALGVFVILAALLVLFAQTQLFQRWVREHGLTLLNNQLQGAVVVDDMHVDVLRGLDLHNLKVYAGGTTLLTANRVVLRYDLSALFARVAAVTELSLYQPSVTLTTCDDGTWNFTRVVKPSTDTTETTPPNGTLFVRQLRIVQGTVAVNDRTNPWPDTNEYFNPTHLKVFDVWLDATIRLNLAAHDIAMAINSLRFKDASGGPLTVNALTAIVRASPSGLDVQELMVEMPRTHIDTRFAISDVDILDGFSESILESHPIIGRIEAHEVWGPDLHYFVPDVDMLGSYSIFTDIEYRGNSIKANHIEIEAGPNSINGSVTINELYAKKPLHIDVAVIHSTGNYADIKQRLRFVPLPDLPFLQTSTIDTAIVRGCPSDSLWIKVNAHDRPGRIDGSLSLLLNDPLLGYHLRANVTGGDVSAFGDTTFATSLNGNVVMDGRGLTLREVNARLNLSLERSMVLGRPVKQLRLAMSANGHGGFVVDTLLANVTAFSQDTSAFEPYHNQERFSMKGGFDLANEKNPTYNLSLASEDLNLARLLRIQGLPSNLSAAISVEMEGIDIDSLRGTIGGHIQSLDLQDRSMFPFDFRGEIQRNGLYTSVVFSSDFADIDVSGEYRPSGLISAVQEFTAHMETTTTEVARHFTTERFTRKEQLIHAPIVSARYSIGVKDVSPLAMLVPDLGVSGSVYILGNINSTQQQLSVGVDTLRVQSIRVEKDTFGFSSDDLAASGEISFSASDNSRTLSTMKFHVFSENDVVIDNTVLRDPRCTIVAQNNTFTIDAGTNIGSTQYRVSGTLQSTIDAAVIRLDDGLFVLDSTQNLRWELHSPATITVAQGIANIESLQAQRPWGETIRLSGILSANSFTGTTITVENFPLADIPKFTAFAPSHPVSQIRGLVTHAKVVVNGSPDKPIITSSMNIADLTYNNSEIGTLSSEMQYSNETVTGKAVVTDVQGADTNNALVLTVGSIPINLALSHVDQRINEYKPWDISAVAHNLNLSVAEPFLPAVERVRGRTNAEMTLRGPTLEQIKLSGEGRYWDGSFLSSSTNITYTSYGSISLNNNILSLDTIVVRNLDRDHRKGYAVASGSVVFNGLNADSVDFTIRTPGNNGILVLNPSSQARSPIVYGDLIIASGDDPIRMYGKLKTPKLTGDVIVLYSDIVFPRERSTTKVRPTSFEYVRLADTSTARSLREYASGTEKQIDKKKEQNLVDPTATVEQAVRTIVEASTASFADILEYNLQIILRGRTLLTMVLSPFEILVADLELVDIHSPLRFTGKFVDNSTNLRGSVRLKEGTSTYKFYKPFQTSGTLNFSSGGMMNPDLNLIAIYQNRRIVNDKPEDYRVQLKITGTKQKPRITYRLWRNDRELVGDSSKIASDALMLILVGKTTDEMMASGQGDLAGQVNAAFSSVATSALSDVISGIGFVQNAQIDLGSDISQSRITLSGQLYGDISYRVSGQISDFSGNSTFTVSVPLTVLGDKEAFRLFQADFSHTVNNTGNITRQTRLWEIKVGARLP